MPRVASQFSFAFLATFNLSLYFLICCSSPSLVLGDSCDLLTELGGAEYVLDESLKLSIVGFPVQSISYVSVPEGSTPLITVKAASEEPSVEFVDSVLTITAADTCSSNTPALSPPPSTTQPVQADTPASDTSTATASLFGLVVPLFAMNIGPIPATMFWATAAIALMTTGASADSNVTTCEPAIELEIQVPYECPYNNFVNGVCMTPKQIADMTAQALFVDFDVDAAASLLAPDYIQHNPTVPTGADPVLQFIPVLKDSGLAIETHRTIAQANLVAYHSTYTNATLFGAPTLIGFDVFRVENGKVQEHWDNLQPLAGPNPSGNTMVDGPTMIKYLGETEQNQQLATGLVQAVLVEGNASAATNFVSTESYTQHNPDIADGLEGLGAALTALAEQGLSFVYDSIELVVAEGNFVLTGSPGEFGAGNPTAYYDLFRLEDGLIVEHWDVIQSIPPAEEFQNDNGKF